MMYIRKEVKKFGNAYHIILGKEELKKLGKEIGQEVFVSGEILKTYREFSEPITGLQKTSEKKHFDTRLCKKHEGSFMGSCGCA